MIHFEIFWDYKWLNVVCLLVTTQLLVLYSVVHTAVIFLLQMFDPRHFWEVLRDVLTAASLTLNVFAWNVLFRQYRIESSSSDCVCFLFSDQVTFVAFTLYTSRWPHVPTASHLYHPHVWTEACEPGMFTCNQIDCPTHVYSERSLSARWCVHVDLCHAAAEISLQLLYKHTIN